MAQLNSVRRVSLESSIASQERLERLCAQAPVYTINFDAARLSTRGVLIPIRLVARATESSELSRCDRSRPLQASGHFRAVPSPRKHLKTTWRDRLPRLFANPVFSLQDAVHGCFHLIERILVDGESAKREFMIKLVRGRVSLTHTVDFQWLSDFVQSLFPLLEQAFAEGRKLLVVPDPTLGNLGILSKGK
jgi:hypothetical protein